MNAFDRAIDEGLGDRKNDGVLTPGKARGANRTRKYPPGTVSAVRLDERLALVVVASEMDLETTKTTTSANSLWTSLLALWDAAERYGHREALSVPIWGANLGRAPGNRVVLFNTMLASLAAWTAEQGHAPTASINIVIWGDNYDPVEFEELVWVLDAFEP